MSTLELTTTNQRKISVEVGIPNSSKGPYPTLIIAPGSGYHMHGEMIESLFLKAVTAGFFTFRFNWSFMKNGVGVAGEESGEASKNLFFENDDLETLIRYASRHSDSHPEKLFLVGKSLGNIVAHSRFLQHPEIRAQVLLTPLCQSESAWEYNYPDFFKVTRPQLVIAPSHDQLCSLEVLQTVMTKTSANTQWLTTPGDHGLHVGSWTEPQYDVLNKTLIDAVCAYCVAWLKVQCA